MYVLRQMRSDYRLPSTDHEIDSGGISMYVLRQMRTDYRLLTTDYKTDSVFPATKPLQSQIKIDMITSK